MNKFNDGDKVKIPKTKNNKPFIKEESELSNYNKDYLIFREGGWYQRYNMGLHRDDNGKFYVNSFYESDLELYEEKYKASELAKNKISVVCNNKNELRKISGYHGYKFGEGSGSIDKQYEYFFYNKHGGHISIEEQVGTFYKTFKSEEYNWIPYHASKTINFSQIDFEEETKTNNNMKLKTFRLAKTEYSEAYKVLVGHQSISEFQKGSTVYEKLKTAGVLDLWCEEVPDTIKIHGYEVKKHNGGYKIGCKFITFQQLQNLKDFIEGNEFSDVSFGSYHITLGEIKQILAL